MTTYEYEVQGRYAFGWECLCAEATKAEARQRLAEYRENEPGTPVRIKRVVAS